jgi:hypothetical protein
MRESRTQQIPSCYRGADKQAVRRHVAAANTRPRKAEFVAHRRPRPTTDIETDERYFSIPLSPPLGHRGRQWSIEVHKGVAICLVTSAALWAGIIAAIRAF